MVTYRVVHPADTTADPLSKGLTVCDPGDVMTGMGFLTAGEARAATPGSVEELTEGSECLAEIPEDLESIPEGGLPLCPLIGYVTCVDLPPFHAPTTGPVLGSIREIELLPEVGPPGHTTTVNGSGFPAGTEVELRWDRGIDCDQGIPVTVAADGTFSTSLLVMANDELGTRTLTAGTADDPNAYPSAFADYLVVPGTAMPPGPDGEGFVIRR